MIKKEIYPKTKRVSVNGDKCYITEKLDGSNLCIFKKNGVLYIAQRNNILTVEELTKDIAYKGLLSWVVEHIEGLSKIRENAVICGEWLGMGKLKYDVGEFDKRFYMFAKANVDDEFNLKSLYYDHSLFIYPFEDEIVPSFIGVVPEVAELNVIPSKEHLDSIYEKYCAKVNRNVEGFVVNYKNNISKYVRMKNGTLQEHFDRGE